MTRDAQNAATAKCHAGGPDGFTLLEVMLAVAIFFAAAFAILALVSQNLAAARRLQQSRVTASGLAAMISLSNRLEEGVESGDLAETYGELYEGFRWEREIVLRETNGLFQVNFAIFDGPRLESTLSILLYRPESIQRRNF
ncbi:MAG: prepilin-type N-terminal cleavage/methylation domain-containing protein [Verrucomicrobiae bacterium]|nr:prepilin-type N-terminal cleavage/methylation domain-containing protein [Verrucomicrobiae bacterium]